MRTLCTCGRSTQALCKKVRFNVKVLLSSIPHHDLFIVGPAAPEETRREIVDWLKEKYPTVKILALNPPHQQVSNADYNARESGPESWLPIVTERFANSTERGAA